MICNTYLKCIYKSIRRAGVSVEGCSHVTRVTGGQSLDGVEARFMSDYSGSANIGVANLVVVGPAIKHRKQIATRIVTVRHKRQ